MTINNLCSDHQRNPSIERCATCNRLRGERRVAKRAIKELIAAGFLLSVNDGEETTTKPTDEQDVLFAALFTTDEDYLLVDDPAGQRKGWVWFIWGNSAAECIADYTVNLEPALKATIALTDRLA